MVFHSSLSELRHLPKCNPMEGGILNKNAGSWAPPQFNSDSHLQEPGIMHFNQSSKGFDAPSPWTGWEALLQALPRGTSTNVIYLGLECSNFYITFSVANGILYQVPISFLHEQNISVGALFFNFQRGNILKVP